MEHWLSLQNVAFGWICGMLNKISPMWDFFLGFSMVGQPEISQDII